MFRFNPLAEPSSQISERTALKCLIGFCVFWCALWFLLPTTLLSNTYIDIMESVVWSRDLQFGYDRNPYVGAWLTFCAWKLSGGSLWIFYLLSQLCVLTAFLCVWKLARSFLDAGQALAAVLLMAGVLSFGMKVAEFNDDVLEIGLWSLTALFYFRALKGQRLRDWLLTGLFSGLAFMTKYYGVVLFASMFLIAVLTEEGRASFKRPGVYLCGLVLLALSAPNALWLWRHDFIAIHYALGRSGLEETASFMRHFTEPFDCLKYALSEIAAALAAFALIFIWRKRGNLNRHLRFEKIFVSCLALGPVGFTLLFSLLAGGRIKCSWLAPDFIFISLLLVTLWRPRIDKQALLQLGAFAIGMGLICGAVFSVDLLYRQPCKKRNCSYEAFPGRVVAAKLTELWRSKTREPLRYAIGDREMSCNLAIFSPDAPRPYFEASRANSPWIDERDLKRRGAIILWKGEPDKRPRWLERLALDKRDVQELSPLTLQRAMPAWFQRLSGLEPKPLKISALLIAPEKSELQAQ